MVKWSYAYYIDNEKGIIEPTNKTETGYTTYLNFYIKAILGNKKASSYKLIADTTEVVSLLRSSVKETLSNGGENAIIHYCEGINSRFLRCETVAKDNVSKMNIRIKSGCLIHALFEESDAYYYLIAKVDWSEYLGRSMQLNQGIEIDDKRLGKSCLFRLSWKEDEIAVLDISVLLDHAAVYFTRDFLEVEPRYSDEDSTKNMVSQTLKLIDKKFQKKQPQDRLLLRNTFLHYVRTNEFIDFNTIQETIFKPYLLSEACIIEEKDKMSFLDALNTLPESGKFNTQFTCIPNVIKERMIKGKDKYNYRFYSLGRNLRHFISYSRLHKWQYKNAYAI